MCDKAWFMSVYLLVYQVSVFFTHGYVTNKNFNFFHFSLVFTFQKRMRTDHSTTITPHHATNSSS